MVMLNWFKQFLRRSSPALGGVLTLLLCTRALQTVRVLRCKIYQGGVNWRRMWYANTNVVLSTTPYLLRKLEVSLSRKGSPLIIPNQMQH